MKQLLTFILFLSIIKIQGQEASKCLYYNGNNQYTTLGNPIGLQLEEYPIELWFYSEENTRSILTRGTSRGAAETS